MTTAGVVASFAQDLVTRITNVQWGGAVFVMGDESGQIFYSDGKGTIGTQFQKVFVIGTDHDNIPPGECSGSSAALVGTDGIVAIVVGGHEHAFDHISPDGEELGHFTIGKIVYSENGITWDTALDMKGDLEEPTTVQKIIWDTDRFYSLAARGLEDNPTSECWISPDGKSWSMSSSEPGGTNAIFESHCKYKDGSGAGLADGEFGLDPSKKGSGETFSYGEVVADGLLITKEDMSNCPVTFANGNWGRADFTPSRVAELEVSTDSGTSWSVVGHITAYDEEDPSSGAIRTLIAAPITVAPSGTRRNARL